MVSKDHPRNSNFIKCETLNEVVSAVKVDIKKNRKMGIRTKKSVNKQGTKYRDTYVIVSDFTGTLSVGGVLLENINQDINQKLNPFVSYVIVTGDEYGTAEKELREKNVKTIFWKLDEKKLIQKEGKNTGAKKRELVERLAKEFSGMDHIAAIGNGLNDVQMLSAVKENGGVAIAVMEGEGVCTKAILASSAVVRSARDALRLVYNPNATYASIDKL